MGSRLGRGLLLGLNHNLLIGRLSDSSVWLLNSGLLLVDSLSCGEHRQIIVVSKGLHRRSNFLTRCVLNHFLLRLSFRLTTRKIKRELFIRLPLELNDKAVGLLGLFLSV